MSYFQDCVTQLAELSFRRFRAPDGTYRPLLTTNELRDSLCLSQHLSKAAVARLVVHHLRYSQPAAYNVAIDCCWWGSALAHLLDAIEDHSLPPLAVPSKVLLVDSDPRMETILQHLWTDIGSDVHIVSGDCRSPDLIPHYLEANIYINTSLEHLPPDYRLPMIAADGLYVLQNTNMLHADGHINCMSSLSDFRGWVENQGLTVESCDHIELPGDGNRRFMIAARRQRV